MLPIRIPFSHFVPRSVASLAGLWLVLASVLGEPGAAQAPPPGDPAAETEAATTAEASSEPGPAAADPGPPAWQQTPRAAMRTFLESFDPEKRPAELGALESAARVLDLSEVPSQVREIRGRELAAELKLVLDRTRLIELDDLPDDPSAAPWRLEVAEGLPVVLAPDEAGRWAFTAATLDRLPDLLRATEGRDIVDGAVTGEPLPFPLRLRSAVPASLLEVGFLLEHWQWLGLLLLAFLGVVLDRVVTGASRAVVVRQLGARIEGVDREEIGEALRPTGILAAALLWWVGIFWLALPADMLQVLLIAVRFVAITAFVWAAYRLVDILAVVLEARAAGTSNRYDDLLVPLVRKSLKIFIAAFGLVFIADNLDVEIGSLLAGLGIGGIALALAAQDTVRNLFGSLTVIVDQPFHVGDWVKIGDVEGTVAEVGFRSTRIRTFYDSTITLPNSQLINAAVDNLGSRTYRRWSTKLSLPYSTPPDAVEAFCEGVRELVALHPYTRKDSFHVYVNELTEDAVDVLLYVFFLTPDWATELRERHRLALDILRLGREVGVDFAFPTRTIHLRRDEGELPEARLPAEGYRERIRSARSGGREAARRLVEGALAGERPAPVGVPDRGESDGGGEG